MKLSKNQVVVFEDGHTEGYMEARWSEKAQAFYSVVTIEVDGYKERRKLYSTDVRDKAPRKGGKGGKMVAITPDHETEKAYAIITGSNGCVTNGNRREFYTWVAKSVCTVKDGQIYAPLWAVR